MRTIILMSLCLLGLVGKTQAQVYMTTTGLTQIFSETPMENISADNKVVSAALNTATKDVAVRIQVIGFKFPNKLMEEHFNENYMESEKFSKATLKGKIDDFDISVPTVANIIDESTTNVIIDKVKKST